MSIEGCPLDLEFNEFPLGLNEAIVRHAQKQEELPPPPPDPVEWAKMYYSNPFRRIRRPRPRIPE